MAARPQNYPITQELLAQGVIRALDNANNNVLSAPDGTVINFNGPLTPFTPTTGQTVAAPDNAANAILYITPASTLAALTVNLPSDANSILGQQVRVATTQTLTSLTVAQAGGGQTLIGAPTTLAANASFLMVKVAANTWMKM